ncbi:IclR family transcriptional regulator [Subtercola lobariae]|uniref:IclR family transcriptional regulator n=2 Tax=Subtercola lobariae TaxID=1588641 RepID=A0A917F1R9_9MICO|nr:IclR family transcriptional regulator [Subtercola lobariae]GGF36297.1 IclR family transcriptional regulator [Subtercola lobariae]
MAVSEGTSRVLGHCRNAVETLAARGPLPPAEVAKSIGVPRPSAYRLASALVHAGLAVQYPDGTVGLSTLWLALGDSALASAAKWFTRDDLLRTLRDETRLTVFLCIPRSNRTVCVRRLHGKSVQVLILKPGGSLPLNIGGVGRITLAFGPHSLDEFLRSADPQPATSFSITQADDLRADVALSRSQGYCLSDNDSTVGVAAIAVPVFGDDGEFLAALSVAGRREEVLDDEAQFSRTLLDTARLIAPRRANG